MKLTWLISQAIAHLLPDCTQIQQKQDVHYQNYIPLGWERSNPQYQHECTILPEISTERLTQIILNLYNTAQIL
jgi:hypothetical protein